MYADDSFFDLTQMGQIGLALLSVVLFLGMTYLTRALLANRPVWVAIPAALFFFWLFLWLSPQIYYLYYLIIIPDLPLQWVIKAPENPLIIFQYLSFSGPGNLANHGKALLGWGMVLSSLNIDYWTKK